jgi:hypothetical protein
MGSSMEEQGGSLAGGEYWTMRTPGLELGDAFAGGGAGARRGRSGAARSPVEEHGLAEVGAGRLARRCWSWGDAFAGEQGLSEGGAGAALSPVEEQVLAGGGTACRIWIGGKRHEWELERTMGKSRVQR